MRERASNSWVREEVRIFVEVHMPWAPNGFEYAYAVDRDDFRDSLTPLPHPPADDFYAWRLREEQLQRRRRQAEQIAAHIANAIIHAAEKQDHK
jgi:hypothetical protein